LDNVRVEEVKVMGNDYLDKPIYLAPLDESPADDNFSVLADRQTIRNLAKRICDKQRHPVTILDINYLKEPQNQKLKLDIRIDSDVEFLSLRNSCKLLRRYAGEELCHKCDSFHAAMLLNMTQATTEEELIADIEKDSKEYPDFFVPSYKIRKPIVKNIKYVHANKETYRLIIEYHCPILGYRELLFPIFFNNKVIGVLFLGQTAVCDKNDLDTIKNITIEFFDNQKNKSNNVFCYFFDKYNNDISKCQITDINMLRDIIIEADSFAEKIEGYLWDPNRSRDKKLPEMTFQSYEKYEAFIINACKELSSVEQELKNSLETKQINYFRKIVKDATNKYFNCQINTDTKNKDIYNRQREDFKNAWECFYDTKEKIKEDLILDDIILFGDGVSLNAIETKKKGVYYKDQNSKTYPSKWRYDFSKIPNSQPSAYEPLIGLDENNELFHGLYSKIERKNVILLIYPDIVMLLRVKDLEKHKDIYKKMAESIGKEFSRVYSDIALRSANFMKERYMLTLRMYRHESAHISTRLNDNFKAYFIPNATKFIDLDDEKQDHITKDMQGAISLISNMSNNIGIIIGSINANTVKGKDREIDVFDLLNKWKIMFGSKLKGRNLDIKVQRDRFTDAPRNIYTNSELFELLLYNLVDNAVKYAYRGSIIYLCWHKSTENNNFYKLTVSSYGPKIKLGNDLYRLYVRGGNYSNRSNKYNAIEGDGMGLYVVRRISKLLKLFGVSHSREFISHYNVPLIKWYLEEQFDEQIYESKKQELRNETPHHNPAVIINTNSKTKIKDDDLSDEYLVSRNDRETWFTMFKVKVPVNMKYQYKEVYYD